MYTLALTNVKSITGFKVSGFVMPTYLGGFNRDEFWEEFCNLHTVNNETELLELVLDLARCHWSPKSTNWPGMDIAVTANSVVINIKLIAGKTKTKDFSARSKFSWTAACLATSAAYFEVYGSNADCPTKPNGSDKGFTQFCSTIDNFTEAQLALCEVAMSAWLLSIGQKARDPTIDAKIKLAARTTLANRTPVNAALSLQNILLIITGDKEVAASRYAVP